MQSSASVCLRVGVLLVALVGLPLVAMLDTAILDAGGPPTVANSTGPLVPPRLPSQTVGGQRASAASPRSSMAIAPGRTVARRSSVPQGEASNEAPPPVDRPSARSTVADLADADIRLVTIQRRLRELGASYYLLEKWGTEGQLYRFHCRVAIGEGGGANRHFEAIDASARTTMQQVLAQVEAWRAAQ